MAVPLALLALLAASACDAKTASVADPPALPQDLANNAVASLDGADGCAIVTAFGIGNPLEPSAITSKVLLWREGEPAWTDITPDPPPPARVAANAVAVGERFYVIGGYTVADDLSEETVASMIVYDLGTGEWSEAAPPPVPVDDTVAAAWLDRYIITVSGWSSDHSVADTQIYDTTEDRWLSATPFPGAPVFGHAGGIVGDSVVVVGGAETVGVGIGSTFRTTDQAWLGELSPEDVGSIDWRAIEDPGGTGRYRAAAGTLGDELWIHGGTETAYNFDALAYEGGEPVSPLGTTLVIDAGSATRERAGPATMDHRALATCDDMAFVVGGLDTARQATPEVVPLPGPDIADGT